MAPAAPHLLLPNFLFSPPTAPARHPTHSLPHGSSLPTSRPRPRIRARDTGATITCCSTRGGTGTGTGTGGGSVRSRSAAAMPEKVLDGPAVDCIGTGTDVECFANEAADSEADGLLQPGKTVAFEVEGGEGAGSEDAFARGVLEWALLVSPFFFWGTAMVAMKEVIPKAGPFFVSAFRLVPAGLMLIGFAGIKGRRQPSGTLAWLSIVLFGIVDAACFQGFLAEGLQKTSAGLGSVIIDSQPLTVSILAALLFGESIGVVGAAGLALGFVGLLLLEVPALGESRSTIWGSGEWWMLLAAQSMAVGTVMVRWVSKYSDPIMATGWHMVIGGLPLLAVSILNHDPALSGGLMELTSNDLLALLYTSIFGSAISYGVYFYNATRGSILLPFLIMASIAYPSRMPELSESSTVSMKAIAFCLLFTLQYLGSLTKLSSLTFLTPMFASIFGFLYLGETFSPLQLVGALVTVVGIYMVNYKVDEKA